MVDVIVRIAGDTIIGRSSLSRPLPEKRAACIYDGRSGQLNSMDKY